MNMEKVELKDLEGISKEDKKMLENADEMFGTEPESMGLIKNMFWGRNRHELLYPYNDNTAEEKKNCETLLNILKPYMKNEHPSIKIDKEQEIPEENIKKLFDMGVMGMTIPIQYGGLGLGVSSYNKVLECIGSYCAATSVLVSAHQSIGCKAIMLFGNEKQKEMYLPKLAKNTVSAFCLSEPNVGCDAGGQESTCELSEDQSHYILNGEKKWSTSGAFSGLFTVMAKQKLLDPITKKWDTKVSALICTADMKGIEIFQNNRSKCGIRGTWQARIRFTNVMVPVANLLHKEGRGLQVALTCLNYGRCTLSAGVVGAAKISRDRAIKWSSTRYQFGRPLSDFELVKKNIADMDALCFAMDSMLYATTGFLDRKHTDIMVETATCKLFCSEMGWRVINHAMQIMGGEGYMTENEVERAFRDSRIYLIVEGANEVMQAFIFGYGGKKLAEQMVSIQKSFSWQPNHNFSNNMFRLIKNCTNPSLLWKAIKLGTEIFIGKNFLPHNSHALDSRLTPYQEKLKQGCADLSSQFKKASFQLKETIIKKQVVQAQISDIAMWLHAANCSMSKLNQLYEISTQSLSKKALLEYDRDTHAGMYFLDYAFKQVDECIASLAYEDDKSMLKCAEHSLAYNDELPNSDYPIPEKSPNASGSGRTANSRDIQQFYGVPSLKCLNLNKG